MNLDRWHVTGEQSGLLSLAPLDARSLKRFEPFRDLDMDLLLRLAPDIALAEWADNAYLFEEGAYIDLAFIIVKGEVRLMSNLHRQPISNRPTSPVRFLSLMGFDESSGFSKMRLGPGDLLGEIGAVSGWPQPFSARTEGQCQLLQVRTPALRLLRRKSVGLQARLSQEYGRQALLSNLQRNPIFMGVNEIILQDLAQEADLRSFEPGETIATEGAACECVFIVAAGFAKISKVLVEQPIVLNYLRPGEIFGATEFLGDLTGFYHTLSAVEYADLICLPHAALQRAIDDDFRLFKRLEEHSKAFSRQCHDNSQDMRKTAQIETDLRLGLMEGTSILKIDLSRCTRCDDCVRACADTHDGIPRFVREGERDGNWLIPKSCYHCRDPLCLVGCPTGAIARRGTNGIVQIEESLCIGCKACAKNCPYDAIMMYETGENWSPGDAPAPSMIAKPKLMASKCDLCEGKDHGPACVEACPVGCAVRV